MANYFRLYVNALEKMDDLEMESEEWNKAEAEMREIFMEGLKANEPHIFSDAVDMILQMADSESPFESIKKEFDEIKEANEKAAAEALDILDQWGYEVAEILR